MGGWPARERCVCVCVCCMRARGRQQCRHGLSRLAGAAFLVPTRAGQLRAPPHTRAHLLSSSSLRSLRRSSVLASVVNSSSLWARHEQYCYYQAFGTITRVIAWNEGPDRPRRACLGTIVPVANKRAAPRMRTPRSLRRPARPGLLAGARLARASARRAPASPTTRRPARPPARRGPPGHQPAGLRA